MLALFAWLVCILFLLDAPWWVSIIGFLCYYIDYLTKE
jgi:hypothetical protein